MTELAEEGDAYASVYEIYSDKPKHSRRHEAAAQKVHTGAPWS